eukprot:COSAG02_NODE_4776_length_4989_cov_8.197327_2_plen_157_part_00
MRDDCTRRYRNSGNRTPFVTELCVLRTFGGVDFSLTFICAQSVPEFLWDRLRATIQFPVMPKRAQYARFSGDHARLLLPGTFKESSCMGGPAGRPVLVRYRSLAKVGGYSYGTPCRDAARQHVQCHRNAYCVRTRHVAVDDRLHQHVTTSRFMTTG